MSREDRVREFDARIRQLCALMLRSEGAEFQTAMMELANAISLWETARGEEGGQKMAKAG